MMSVQVIAGERKGNLRIHTQSFRNEIADIEIVLNENLFHGLCISEHLFNSNESPISGCIDSNDVPLSDADGIIFSFKGLSTHVRNKTRIIYR